MNNLVSIILVYLALSRKEMKENVTETLDMLIITPLLFLAILSATSLAQ